MAANTVINNTFRNYFVRFAKNSCLIKFIGVPSFNARASHYSARYFVGHNSPAAAAREVFKSSTDSASLLVPSKKKIFFNFGFGVLLGGRHKWGCFSAFMAYFTHPWTPIE